MTWKTRWVSGAGAGGMRRVKVGIMNNYKRATTSVLGLKLSSGEVAFSLIKWNLLSLVCTESTHPDTPWRCDSVWLERFPLALHWPSCRRRCHYRRSLERRSSALWEVWRWWWRGREREREKIDFSIKISLHGRDKMTIDIAILTAFSSVGY